MKNIILTLLIFLLPLGTSAQKITIGSCNTMDGGLYRGEMAGGKPHGKGNTLYSNGETYEGEYFKGRRQGNGSRTNNTATALVISPTTINTWVFGFVGINKVMA